MKTQTTQLSTWTVKIEMLVQHVTFVDVEASSAEEAADIALRSEDEHDFEEEVEASKMYVYSVTDGDGWCVEFSDAREAGHMAYQKVDVRGLESLPEGALDDIYARLVKTTTA